MIGFYVHHAGNGHLGRVRSIIAALGTEATVLSSLPAPADWGPGTAWCLPARDDGDGAPRDPEAGGVLHWAPLGHAGLRERMGAIAGWVTRHRPSAFYVDVSVEVAAAVRLMGVPVVVAAMPGERVDRPHPARLRPGQPDPRPLAGGRLPPRLPRAAPAQDLLRRRHLPVRRSRGFRSMPAAVRRVGPPGSHRPRRVRVRRARAGCCCSPVPAQRAR